MPTATLRTKISMTNNGTETISHTIPSHLPISSIRIKGNGHLTINNYNHRNITYASVSIMANNVSIYSHPFTNLGSADTISTSFSFDVTLTNSKLYYSTLSFSASASSSSGSTSVDFSGDIYRMVTLNYASAGSVIRSDFLDAPWAFFKMSNVKWSHVGSALTYPADTNWTSGSYTAAMNPVGDGTTVQAKAVNALIDTICTQAINRYW